MGDAHSLTFGPDGNLYVADTSNSRIMEYNGTTGAFLRVFASGNGLSGPTGLTFAPNGNLLVSSNANNQVLEYNGTTGSFLTAFVSPGSGGLSDPHGLVFPGDGDLYVSGGNGIQRYDGTTGSFIDLFASSGALSRPTYMTFSPSVVPEPTSVLLLGIGTVGLLSYVRLRGAMANRS